MSTASLPLAARKLLAGIHALRLARWAGELDPVEVAQLAEIEWWATRQLVRRRAVASWPLRDESVFLNCEEPK